MAKRDAHAETKDRILDEYMYDRCSACSVPTHVADGLHQDQDEEEAIIDEKGHKEISFETVWEIGNNAHSAVGVVTEDDEALYVIE